MFLLDTCTFLWITSEPEKLSARVQECVKKNAANLFLSAISAFEIAVKARKGKLELPMDVGKWYVLAMEHHGITEIPVSSAIAIASTKIPLQNADPCDRMIAATAKQTSLIVLTPDFLLKECPEINCEW